ncbi:hypothetical protein DIPPA_11914 [Diplonema papillatum]|nr:hypothetical protein DIPPA_11914 [Diplonema papillatum]
MIYVFFELCFLTYAPLFHARSFTVGSAPLRAEETGLRKQRHGMQRQQREHSTLESTALDAALLLSIVLC